MANALLGTKRPQSSCGSCPRRPSRHIELGDIPNAVDRLADVPTVVMCGHGERAMGAASLLTRHGLTQLSVLDGGPEEWAEANGQRLETSP